MNERIIHTKLYSKIALEVLQNVEENLSDGLWENSPAMKKYRRFSDVESAPDGEVLIKINTEQWKWNGNHRSTYNGFHDMTDAEVIKWFAGKIKHIMQVELKYEGMPNSWKRNNDKFETKYLSYHETITVRDVYFIYDFLLGRTTATKYDPKAIIKVVCSPKSDEETKAEETRCNKIANLEAKWLKTHEKLLAERDAAIEKIKDEYNTTHSKLWNEFVRAKEEIKNA